MKQSHGFDPNNPTHLTENMIPKMPQCLEMVNQTVSIPKEPEKSNFIWRNIIEYKVPTDEHLETFENAVQQKQ